MANLHSLLGFVTLCLLAWLAGGAQRPVPWRSVIGSAAIIFVVGAAVFLIAPVRWLLLVLNDAILVLIDASARGAIFLLGPLALPAGEQTPAGEPSIGFVLAGQVLPAVVFFAAFMAVLHHLGLIEPVVRWLGRIFHRTLRLSGAEALAGSLHLFFGVETGAAVRPYLLRMTHSELALVVTTNLATTASTVLAIYVVFLRESFPQIAGHLMSASLLSIPCSVLAVKLMIPETEAPETAGDVPRLARETRQDNVIAALAHGANNGLRIAAGIAAILIAVLGFVGVADELLVRLGTQFDAEQPWSLAALMGWAFTPLTWLLGLPTEDLAEGSRLLGQRLLLTEVVSYQELGALGAAGTLSPRSLLVLSYALCGFAHVGGLGIALGGFGALAPDRLGDLGAIALRALVAATLATLMTGAVAGVFYFGQSGLLGL